MTAITVPQDTNSFFLVCVCVFVWSIGSCTDFPFRLHRHGVNPQRAFQYCAPAPLPLPLSFSHLSELFKVCVFPFLARLSFPSSSLSLTLSVLPMSMSLCRHSRDTVFFCPFHSAVSIYNSLFPIPFPLSLSLSMYASVYLFTPRKQRDTAVHPLPLRFESLYLPIYLSLPLSSCLALSSASTYLMPFSQELRLPAKIILIIKHHWCGGESSDVAVSTQF